VDHAWRLDLDNVSADTTLNFSHNVNFTDINLSTGIDDLPSFMDEIKLYPNPVKHNVFVSFNNAEVDDFTLGIFNPAGVQLRRIAQKHIGFPIDIDVSDFESGLYFIKVETSNQKGVFKFIKQ